MVSSELFLLFNSCTMPLFLTHELVGSRVAGLIVEVIDYVSPEASEASGVTQKLPTALTSLQL